MLRPLVFSPQYSLFVAPWNMRSLPQIGCDVDREIENRHLGERRPAVTSTDNSLAQHVPLHVVRRLGREWEMKPPCAPSAYRSCRSSSDFTDLKCYTRHRKLGRAAIFGLLNSLDLDPCVTSSVFYPPTVGRLIKFLVVSQLNRWRDNLSIQLIDLIARLSLYAGGARNGRSRPDARL